MSATYNTVGSQKSIPASKAIATPIDVAEFGSTGAQTGVNIALVDLMALSEYQEGLFRVEAKTINGQGGTPTSPGAAVTITVHWAFWNTQQTLADVPTIAVPIDDTFTITLPDSNSSAAAGTRLWSSDTFVGEGRFVYFWLDADAFAANALVDLQVDLVRL